MKLSHLCCLLLCLAVYSACRYPYNTPQARRARREAKIAKRAALADKHATPTSLWAHADSLVSLAQRYSKPTTISDKAPSKKGKLLATDSAALDTAGGKLLDSTKVALRDSLGTIVPPDSPLVVKREIVFSKDSLDSQVDYSAEDSMIYDIAERKVYLYGNARVAYKEFSLNAGFIIIDLNASVAIAEGKLDSAGNETQRPSFKDPTQAFDCKKIEYNFKSNKGKVYEASTQQGDGYFLSESTKFVAKEKGDSTANDIIYSSNCIYTTCNHRHPHFGIRGSKAKVIPNKLIVLGTSHLEIMGTPTPIILPFAFFPLNKQQERKSGIIFSTNVEFSPTFGPGIRGMGYYWAFSDYIDLALTTDVYMRGSFRLYATSNYAKRYKYKGSFRAAYARLVFDEKGTPDYKVLPDFNIAWEFSQDAKAHPSQSFSASVNFGTSGFFRNNTTSATQVLQGSLQSRIAYTKRFGKSFTFALNAAHSQNTQTRIMSVTLPKATLTMNIISPFKRKISSGDERWYEKIKLGYSGSFENKFSITDSVLFAAGGLQKALDTMEYNIVHNPTLTMNFKLLKYINVQPNVRYSEYWFFKGTDYNFDPTLLIKYDTIVDSEGVIQRIDSDTTYGQVSSNKTKGFYAVRDLSAGVNLNTQTFFFNNFSIGRLYRMMALVRPEVGFQWRPDYTNDFWGYYDKVQKDARYPTDLQSYKRFSYVPSGGKSALLTYSLSGRVEGKWRKSASDTTGERYKKIILINNWTLSGNYNMAVDSFNWSVVRAGANTTLFKQIQLTWAATFDPYTADKTTNKQLPVLEWNENKRLVRWTNMNFNISSSFTSQHFRDWFGKKGKSVAMNGKQQAQNSNFQFLQNMTLAYNLNVSNKYAEGRDTVIFTTNEVSVSGTFNLSQNWNFRVGRIGYDFANKRTTFPDFTFSRNLHCWEMGLNWQPQRETWAFFLRVRPSSLGFINVPVRKTFYEAY